MYKGYVLENFKLVQRLELLTSCEQLDEKSSQSAISWIPDWSTTHNTQYVGIVSFANYATGFLSSQATFHPPNRLDAQGVKFSSISSVRQDPMESIADVRSLFHTVRLNETYLKTHITDEKLVDFWSWTFSFGMLRDRYAKVRFPTLKVEGTHDLAWWRWAQPVKRVGLLDQAHSTILGTLEICVNRQWIFWVGSCMLPDR